MKFRLIQLLLSIALSMTFVSIGHAELPKGTKSGFIEVEGGPVWYDMMGDGNGTPLMVLHGGPGYHTCGFQRLAKLGDERRVVRYDQLGSGRSGRPRDTSLWNRDRFVRELTRVRKDLGLEEVHILGASWGASLAAYYFLETGGPGVKSLILQSPLISTKRWIEDANRLRKTLPQDVQDALTRNEKAGTINSEEYKRASDIFYDNFVTRGEVVEDVGCRMGLAFDVYEYMWGPTEFNATGTLLDFDISDRLKDIDVPTLFMTGEFDEAMPETVKEYAAMVPNARVEIINGVAHSILPRVPDEYRAILRDFLASVEKE
ncbi:MAG: proline iminopeptidase-family hydrolase [Pseudomonadota bacterium]